MPLFCSHCGAENDAGSHYCGSCDSVVGHVPGAKKADRSKDGTSPFTSPTSDSDSQQSSTAKSPLVWGITAGLCALYLVYPSFGIFELIPDNIPIVGNLDEAAATTGLLLSLVKLGWVPFQDKT